MDWMSAFRNPIDYMEKHLLRNCSVKDVAGCVNISPFYFQKGFALLTGYSISEYMRNRRLYFAALDVIDNQEKIINLSYKYGYDTPESFTKAFKRFHGLSPSLLRKEPYRLISFLSHHLIRSSYDISV